jgi:hypothetical protein
MQRVLLKKLAAVSLMGLIVAGFAVADTALLYRAYVRREFVISELERLAGRPVNLGDISFGPFKGLVAEGFEIPKKNGQPLLRAERIRVQLDGAKLMTGTVRIASVELEQPLARLEVSKDGKGELIELIAEVARHAGESTAAGGPIPRISVTGGELVFAHEAFMNEGLEIAVRDIDARILPYGLAEFVVQGEADAGALGRWRIEGRIDTTTGRSEARIGTKGLVLGPGSVAAFGAEVRRIYDKYNVAGPVDAEVTGTYDPREAKPVSVTAEVRPQGVSVEYANFRYRVLNVRGLIRLKDDGIEFQGMTARFWANGPDGESPTPQDGHPAVDIAMSGSTDGYVGESAYTLHFDIGSLPISAKLRGALQADARHVYDLFEPTGLLRGKVDVIKPRGAGQRVAHNIEMSLVGCTARFKPFPLPVEDVSGLIVLRGDALTIESAKCRHGNAWFTVSGSLTSIEADGGIDVTVDSDDVKLTPDASTDPRALALPEAVRRIWKHFSPVGSVSLHWVTKRAPGPGQELTYDVTVRPKDLKATFDGVPYPLTDIAGEVWTDAKRVEVRGLAGKRGAARVAVSGAVTGLDGDPAYDLAISASQLPIDGDLKAALPPDFASMLADLDMKGSLGFDDLHFRRGGGTLEPGISHYEANTIRIEDASFDAGLGFREVREVELSMFGTQTPTSSSVHGRLKNASLRVEDVKVSKLGATWRFGDGELRIEDIEGTAYDGRISGAVTYSTRSSDWSVDLKAANIDLMQLTSDSAMKGKNVKGRADGELRMQGTGGNSNGFTGSGGISFKDSDLYEVPLLVSVFNVLKFADTKDVFRKGLVTFDVEDRRFRIKDLLLESDSMDLESDRGDMDFDGNIRLKLSPVMHNLVTKPLDAFTAVYVRGTFQRPSTEILPALRIEALFPKRKRK